MNLTGRNLVTLDDLSNEEIEAVFELASEMEENAKPHSDLCSGKIMASLFFEPSTRTRLSFEASMHRLGGDVITATEFDTTSLAKGESLADMARVVGSYADIIVIRHPWEGAARVVAEYAGVPVINGGDGSHEHPTQTLCDLYTLKKERKQLSGLRIALCGDLKSGRTVHSLAYGLARFGAQTITFCNAPGLEMPNYVIRKLMFEYGGTLKKVPAGDLPAAVNGNTNGNFDAMYMTPSEPHELALVPQINIKLQVKEKYDSIYITRFQRERGSSGKQGGDVALSYPIVDSKLLKKPSLKETLVMHPLPRLAEITRDLDADPRSMYFKQAARGVPIRMALLSLLLGVKAMPSGVRTDTPNRAFAPPKGVYEKRGGIVCNNPSCVTNMERPNVEHRFSIVPQQPLSLRCAYCDHEEEPQYVCDIKHKTCHSCASFPYTRIALKYRLFLKSSAEAYAKGFNVSISR